MGALRRGDPHGAVFVSVDDAGVVNGLIEVSSRAEAAGCHSQRAHRHLGLEDIGWLVHFRKELG